MAMLAEKRKRVKYCLNPNGNEWNNDDKKFGQKLLEKMGWQKGQGLGLNNQGITERLKVAYKFDSTGLGFKEKDVLLQQQNDFQNLLSQLNCKNTENIKEQHAISSLEEKSKKSKSRVHYKKFTRGKDISRYSSKDLSSILGTAMQSNPSLLDCGTENKGNIIYGSSTNSCFKMKTKKNSGITDGEEENKIEFTEVNENSNETGPNEPDLLNCLPERGFSKPKKLKINRCDHNEVGECKKEHDEQVLIDNQEVNGRCDESFTHEIKKQKKSKIRIESELQVCSEVGATELKLQDKNEIYNHDSNPDLFLKNDSVCYDFEINNQAKRKKNKKSKKEKLVCYNHNSEGLSNGKKMYNAVEDEDKKSDVLQIYQHTYRDNLSEKQSINEHDELFEKKSKKRKRKSKSSPSAKDVQNNDNSVECKSYEAENHKSKKKSEVNCVNGSAISVEDCNEKNQDVRICNNIINNSINCEQVSFCKKSKKRKQKLFDDEGASDGKHTQLQVVIKQEDKGSIENSAYKSEDESKKSNQTKDPEQNDSSTKGETILDRYLSSYRDVLERKRLQKEFKRNAVPEFNGFVGSNLFSVKGYDQPKLADVKGSYWLWDISGKQWTLYKDTSSPENSVITLSVSDDNDFIYIIPVYKF